MDTAGRTRAAPDDDPVERLVAECLARLSAGDSDPLTRLCADHPEHAIELRRRQQGLLALGLWTRGDGGAAPRRIGPFDLRQELGRGGMGVVYLASQAEPLRRLAALKVIAGRASPQALQRFATEQQALASLVHPNIAQVLEAGTTDDGEPWYAMEFVDGTTLTHYCRERRLSVPARLALFLQLCDAVQFAHQQGVLHRDLKPGNVLVCERGGQPLVKVIDFGLAKALAERADATPELTLDGQILGTPEYMSPEQALGTSAKVDTRSDVYALGAMLYELLAGVLPFDFDALRGEGLHALLRAVREVEPPPVSVRFARLGPDRDEVAATRATTAAAHTRALRGDLDWITAKALRKDREERYATVSELAADVRRHLRNQPVQAGPPSALYLLRKFVRRHRAGVAFAAAALLGLVVALAVVANLLVQRNENLRRFDALQVAIDFDGLQQGIEAETWPARPEHLPSLDAWLARARAIVGQLPTLLARLAELRREGEPHDGGLWFAAPRDRFLHERLAELVPEIEQFAAPGGPLEAAAARRAWAAGLRKATIDDLADRWREAIATIADEDQCPDYHGLVITPQLGFVPLERDLRSRLYEFALLRPGERLPARGADGNWIVAQDTCMVFVLIPGDVAHLGLEYPDFRLPNDFGKPFASECLPHPDGSLGHGFPVRLNPFFLSKYEMSQAQWQRLMGTNPSFYSPEQWGHYGITTTHPVGTVSALMADQAVRRLGLALPTSAQWQYAARARSEAPWWTGFAIDGWHGAENLADESTFRATTGKLQGGAQCDRTWDDHWAVTAPVDSLRPNAFGLHHVLGNVSEWSRDPGHLYTEAMPQEGDGAAATPDGTELNRDRRDVLGGSGLGAWLTARSTRRDPQPATNGARSFGLRPARGLTAPE